MKKTMYYITYEVIVDRKVVMADMDEEVMRLNMHLNDQKYYVTYTNRSSAELKKTDNGFRMVIRFDNERLVCRAMRYLTHREDVTNIKVDY